MRRKPCRDTNLELPEIGEFGLPEFSYSTTRDPEDLAAPGGRGSVELI